MIKTPLNLAMLGDPEAQQFCEMLSLSDIFSPLTDGGCGPTGVVLAVDSVQITFPTCVDIVAATGIEVNIGGAGWEAVASVSGGSDRVWEFATTTEIAEDDVILWQYLGAEDSIVDCTEAVDVGALDPVTVRNPLELTAPTLVSAEVGTIDDSTFVLVFSEDISSADFAVGWSIEADATPLTITGATEVSAGTLRIIVSENIESGQTVTISYDADTGDIADATGYPAANVLASITDEAVTNNVAGGDVTLISIAITPDAQTINSGATQQFTATGTYSDSSTADITATVTWDSSDDAVATITTGGLATGVSYGQATISATLGAVSDTTTLSVWSPIALFTGGIVGVWFDSSDFATMFQDTAGTTPVTATGQSVRRINDKSGNGYNATQSDSAKAPKLQQDAGGKYYLDFDGTDDWLRATFTATYPMLRVSGVHQESFTNGDQVFGGVTGNGGVLYQTNPSPTLIMYAGASGPTTTGVTVGATKVVTEYFDGASSYVSVNAGTHSTGNPGTTVPGGLTLGSQWGTPSTMSDIRVYQVVMASKTPGTGEVESAENFVASKCGVTL